ncbi:uncharacterized protein LOC115778170 [Archocentrus centrarchus]|uniref:uncharacterized protein LOC115778170 n=1 Tax=Archocentrus centrarchus TaxID=63155 RepID=UPI0011E9C587|nr:uncharacterized protein LOC115778170 [Archocentrus centrarchus]
MASSGILSFIFTALYITAVKSGDFVKVECKTKNLGHYGQQSLLECVIQMSKDVQDPVIRVVAWKKLSSPGDEDGKIMLGYSKSSLQTTQGYRFAEPSWNERNMNVSLLITNTAVTDEGLYSCMVITDSGDHTSFTTLKVQAKYSAPTVRSAPEKIVPNIDSALICESDGGYPKGKLRWFDGQNYEWTESSELEVKQTPSGLFQLSSTLYLFGGSTALKYKCAVYNAHNIWAPKTEFCEDPTVGDKTHVEPMQDGPIPGSWALHFTLGPIVGSPMWAPRHDPRPAELSKLVTPFVVMGSLIVGLLCVLLLYRRRSLQPQRHSTAPLMGKS